MGRGVKSVSKKMPTDLCLLQLWSSSWSAQRRDGSTTPLFHEKSCGLVHSATNIMMFFMNLLYLQNRFFWAIFCFICSFSISYSKRKQNNWDLGFSGLTSLFYYFFPLHLCGVILLKAQKFYGQHCGKFIFSFGIINNLVRRRA